MITRAYIVDITPNKAKIRIPILDGFDPSASGYTPDENLSWASILAIPGIEVDFRKGDVVIVGFQDSDIGSPIILGHLKSSISKDATKSIATLSDLNVLNTTSLSKNTTIGNLTYDQLQGSASVEPIDDYDIDLLFE